MTSYDFTIRLDRAPTETEIDALYEAGCDDGSVEYNLDTGYGAITFDREGPSLSAAITSAVRDIAKTPLRAVGIVQDDDVMLRDIAARAGRSYEAARLWAAGKRAGGFPPPRFTTAGGERFWSWIEVAAWLRDRLGIDVPATPHEIIAADRVLAAAAALRGESDEIRAELQRLLVA